MKALEKPVEFDARASLVEAVGRESSARVRLAFASAMADALWLEARDILCEMLEDEVDFGTLPRGSGAARYEVARAAVQALAGIADLREEHVAALWKRACYPGDDEALGKDAWRSIKLRACPMLDERLLAAAALSVDEATSTPGRGRMSREESLQAVAARAFAGVFSPELSVRADLSKVALGPSQALAAPAILIAATHGGEDDFQGLLREFESCANPLRRALLVLAAAVRGHPVRRRSLADLLRPSEECVDRFALTWDVWTSHKLGLAENDAHGVLNWIAEHDDGGPVAHACQHIMRIGLFRKLEVDVPIGDVG